MAVNIEIKAHSSDFHKQKQLAETLSDSPCQVIEQVDTFLNSPHGRLKMRILGNGSGQLVYYTRPNTTGPKRSDYCIYPTNNPSELIDLLAKALGVRGVIRKTRLLYLVGQTRIHFDTVEGLGEFIELEVVMRDNQSNAEGQEIADELMKKLGILEADLIEGAYIDMLEAQN